jgi:hypothetical protein
MGHISKSREDPMSLVYLQMYMQSIGVEWKNVRPAQDPRILRVYRLDGQGVEIQEFRHVIQTVETSVRCPTSAMIAVEEKQFNFISLNITDHGLSPSEYYEEKVSEERATEEEDPEEDKSTNMSD